jgi:uncharacterized protein (DUF608 family)
MSTENASTPLSSWPRTFSGTDLLQIAMPMGGIGAGCICLNGVGGLQDFSIRHAPATTALPDGWGYSDGAFAIIHIKGESPITKLLEGPVPPERIYDQGVQGQGFRKSGSEGLPRFENCSFRGPFPFGLVSLNDPRIPVKVEIEGWNPFIPLDDVKSGIPCAVLSYTFENCSSGDLSFEFSFHWSHPVQGKAGEKGTRNLLMPGRGVLFTNTEPPDHSTFGSAALVVKHDSPKVKAMWFRGGWFDSISSLWREVSAGKVAENDGSISSQGLDGRNGGSVLVSIDLKPGERATVPVVLTWYLPNCGITSAEGSSETAPGTWHPFYAAQWKDAGAVADYVLDNFDELYRRTCAFRDALCSSTLPASVLDAVSSNLAILKSPTVLRQSNGNVWAWEGCNPSSGCCSGSCTHVWNYAQALPHLFPALERTLREQELVRSMDDRGHVNFRSSLPDGPTTHGFHAASDGQLGGILKVFREWQISGDGDWLRGIYPYTKRSLDFCILAWDPKRQGALFEPHHNTYDIEFWGPDGMCTSVYLGALCAMALMAKALDKLEDAEFYDGLASKCAAYLDGNLFNGEYYEQRVQWEGLRDKSFVEMLARFASEGATDEMSTLLRDEGPKYQYGVGCISDGVIGAWMAEIYGVDAPLDKAKVRSHLQAIFHHNFKADLFDHACLQRPGYALGHEPGLLLCTWPRGNKPTLPFVYSDEVWTGIEYQVASHMIELGLVEEGLTIVEAVRSRYEGHVRNPFCEYECGSYYARALASYALLGSLSGFRYSAVDKSVRLDPKLPVRPFKTFFSTASGYGTITLNDILTIEVVEGFLEVESIILPEGPIACAGVATPGRPIISE